MTGYQEILTDPSYAGQIVTLTYPHIGNVGVNAEDVESRPHLRGGPRDPRPAAPGIELARDGHAGRLPARQQRRRHRRHRHAQADAHPARKGRAERLHRRRPDAGARRTQATRLPRRAPRRRWRASTWRRSCRARSVTTGARAAGRSTAGIRKARAAQFHVVAYDFGIKHNILRMLAERGCRLTVVPAQTAGARRARDAARTACSCPTVPATRSLATTRLRPFARSSTAACRRSASASAINCWGWPPARARSR